MAKDMNYYKVTYYNSDVKKDMVTIIYSFNPLAAAMQARSNLIHSGWHSFVSVTEVPSENVLEERKKAVSEMWKAYRDRK